MMPVCESVPETTPGAAAGWFSTRVQIAMSSCACAGASIFVYLVDPGTHSVYPQCFLYNATGIYCAGCGATRALHALLHGRILEALHDNALFVVALPLLLYVAAPHAWTAWRENLWPKIMINESSLLRGGIGFLLVTAAFMLMRNLSGLPFAWLRPG